MYYGFNAVHRCHCSAVGLLCCRVSIDEPAVFAARTPPVKAGPVQETNPQGEALARLFQLPKGEADRASTYQQFAIAVIVELLIAGAFRAFDLQQADTRAARKSLSLSPASSVSSPVAIRMTFTAFPITSAGRF